MQNLIDKKNPLLKALSIHKFCDIFTCECFFFEHFKRNKMIMQKIWKIKNILFKTLPGFLYLYFQVDICNESSSNSSFLIPKKRLLIGAVGWIEANICGVS